MMVSGCYFQLCLMSVCFISVQKLMYVIPLIVSAAIFTSVLCNADVLCTRHAKHYIYVTY